MATPEITVVEATEPLDYVWSVTYRGDGLLDLGIGDKLDVAALERVDMSMTDGVGLSMVRMALQILGFDTASCDIYLALIVNAMADAASEGDSDGR